ncbi:hypothetical protein [Haloechinothrix salitolerans]|uniref:DnaB-like helicase N terminal domain-containing protein n=1 Tax=Haloechinothrix salitolerans TaxID=926830 RepID=A0ABW2BT53_9PSEU
MRPIATDIERQFVGTLLWLPTHQARTVLAGMRADDLATPMPADVLQIVIELVAAGHDPAPVAVFSHAVITGRAPGETRRGWLGKWLADTYTACQATTPAHAQHLKAVVLEAAWRRAIAEHAARLAQAARDSATDVLAALADDTSRIDALWARYRTALDPTDANARVLKEVA